MSSTSRAEDFSNMPLVVDTPERQAYYYEKIEQSAYNAVNYLTGFPESATCKTWLALGDAGQKAVVSQVKKYLAYGSYDLNIEDQKELDDVTDTFLRITLVSMVRNVDVHKPNKGSAKATKKLATGNSLLKTAIRHSRVEKQTKSSLSAAPS